MLAARVRLYHSIWGVMKSTFGRFLPLEPRTIANLATESLRIAILSGKYLPGDKLVEAELTAELEVSRGPVREALRRLESEGLVTIEPHRGAAVRHVSRKFIRNMFEIREVLEGLAARLAAKRMIDRDNHDSFERELADIGSEEGALPHFGENQRFHQLIVDSSGNEDLISGSYQLQFALCSLQFQRLLASDVDAAARGEHEAITEAILTGDAQKAERLMRSHIRRAGKQILRLPDDRFGE